jgi:hypothetical protein
MKSKDSSNNGTDFSSYGRNGYHSASASRNFAAAIQDYKRELLSLGSIKHTYGKGEVQT